MICNVPYFCSDRVVVEHPDGSRERVCLSKDEMKALFATVFVEPEWVARLWTTSPYHDELLRLGLIEKCVDHATTVEFARITPSGRLALRLWAEDVFDFAVIEGAYHVHCARRSTSETKA